ncbi:HSF_DNA-bind domain-containing protein [Cephalotus follicularis]|uniref:HSF_DNA-bind domain-containing protein n=1 Tax=Cephalotus follicularis TaxID=3775 RepID=A0A1Q3CCL6_CEPFO|nr:HSF_DNA-bind domain-containing protein [Cephalotus follicularis]
MDGVHESIAQANSVPPFLSKTYDVVDDPSTNSVVSWSDSNNSFVVWNVHEFSRDILPKSFKHNNFSSFVRQLNTYGFRKVDPNRWEFANEGFLRGQKHLLKNISRRKPANNVHSQQPQVQTSSVGVCVELGKFGLEEEVERLQRDKNVLMQELVRLRQQQQATDHQLQTVGQRVHVMEQRQQQMMSFLAKAMQSPGFLNQLVQQQTESNRLIVGGSKKRRLPRQDEENLASQHGTEAPNGQIVKYQPSMNVAAKAMVHQILKMNASPRLEPSMSNPSTFLIGDIPSSNPLDNGNSLSRISEVTLSEVPPLSGRSYMPPDSASLVNPPSTAQILENNGHNSREDTVLPYLTGTQGVMSDNIAGIPDATFVDSEAGDAEYVNPMSTVLDGTLTIENAAFSPDHDMDILLEGAPKLPGINDVFWEQFLAGSPLIGDTDEINSSCLESGVTKEQELQLGQNGWDKVQHMDHLTEQMGLLIAENRIG